MALLATAACVMAQTPPRPQMEFPDGPAKEIVVKVCGSCHGAEVVVAKGRTRQGWSDVITRMVTWGAKASHEEFAQILNYLAINFPPQRAVSAGRGGPSVTAPRPGGMGQGADDKHVVDAAAAGRGRTVYIAECITCHGPNARGADNGPDLVRSVTILHDRYGNDIGPFLHKGHPMQSGKSSAALTKTQVEDLSHFLHQKVYEVLRGGPQVINVLTGDAKAGEAYFNGAGRCNTCHSPTGDLAGIAKKYDPATLQQRFVFPRTIGFGRRGIVPSKPVTLTVTPASGRAVSGVLISLDDFNVSLRDTAGEYLSWKRTPDLKVEKHDPYAAHIALLEEYTDNNIHDVVAYLETLK